MPITPSEILMNDGESLSERKPKCTSKILPIYAVNSLSVILVDGSLTVDWQSNSGGCSSSSSYSPQLKHKKREKYLTNLLNLSQKRRYFVHNKINNYKETA